MAPQELEILCSEELAVPHEDLALSEAEFFEKNTFIDFPVPPMARPSTPSASAPAGFLQRFLLPPKQSMTASPLPLGASCSTECSESDTMEILATLEELPEKNTFIDFPPIPMACPSTPTASAPAFLHRLQHLMTPEQGTPVVEASKALQCEDSQELVEEALGLPSMGSADHHVGKCSPCAWYWKSGGCRNAATCIYCHLCPEGTRKAMKKAKVAMFRQQELEPVYVPMSPVPSEAASPASVESLEVLQKPSVHFAENYLEEDDGRAPVKVSIKNTFIQFEVPSSPKNTSAPPLRSAPGDFFRRFFSDRGARVLGFVVAASHTDNSHFP